jgi:hypothetical protein
LRTIRITTRLAVLNLGQEPAQPRRYKLKQTESINTYSEGVLYKNPHSLSLREYVIICTHCKQAQIIVFLDGMQFSQLEKCSMASSLIIRLTQRGIKALASRYNFCHFKTNKQQGLTVTYRLKEGATIF